MASDHRMGDCHGLMDTQNDEDENKTQLQCERHSKGTQQETRSLSLVTGQIESPTHDQNSQRSDLDRVVDAQAADEKVVLDLPFLNGIHDWKKKKKEDRDTAEIQAERQRVDPQGQLTQIEHEGTIMNRDEFVKPEFRHG